MLSGWLTVNAIWPVPSARPWAAPLSGAVEQAQIARDRLPPDADFTTATSFNREEWRTLLSDMSKWGR